MVTRSAEKARKKSRSESEREGGARSDPTGNRKGTKRKILVVSESENDDHEGDDNEKPSAFNLFASDQPKKDWDEHPDMDKLIELGNNRMEKIGFSSPKPETQGITMYEIARQNNIKLPRKRDDAVKVLVRTLAIERIKELDKTAVNNYTDLQENSSK